MGSCKFNNNKIVLIDTPGIHDTKEPVEKTLAVIYNAIARANNGITSFLFVLKLGERFAKEKINTVEAFKTTVGDEFLKKHCVIVLTNADNYPDVRNDSILEWCKNEENVEKGSELEQLLIECNYRVVSFNDRNTSKENRDKCVKKLLSYFPRYSANYTNKTFEQCRLQRDEYVTRLGNPEQRSDILRQLCLLEGTLHEIITNYDDSRLGILQVEAWELLETVKQASVGTAKTNDLKIKIEQIVKKIEQAPKTIEERKRAMTEIKKEVREISHGGAAINAITVCAIFVGAAAVGIGSAPVAVGGFVTAGVMQFSKMVYRIAVSK